MTAVYAEIYLENLVTENGDWLAFPLDEEEITNFIVEKKISTNFNPEYRIADYMFDGCDLQVSEFDDVYRINELLERFYQLDRYEQAKVNAYMEINFNSVDTFEQAMDSLDRYELVEDISTDEELGIYCADGLFTQDIPRVFENYFDFEAYGRDARIEGYATFTKYGCLFNY